MKYLSALVALALLLGVPLPAVAADAYRLEYGDVLDVTVVGNDELALKGASIRPDGRLSVPMVGEVQAGGLTATQLATNLQQRYAKFLVHASVIVNVAHFRQVEVTVLGQVTKPGTYQSDKAVTILKALALAGGPIPERADMEHVQVIDAHGHQRSVDLTQALQGDTTVNVELLDGDTLTVLEPKMPDFGKLWPLIPSVLSLAATLVILGWKH